MTLFRFLATSSLFLIVTATAAVADDQNSSAAGTHQGGYVTGAAEMGFDSFQEKYTLVDSDTVDSVSEFRMRMRLGYAHGSQLRNHFTAQALGAAGEGNSEWGGRLRVTRMLGLDPRSRVSVEGEYLRRKFDETSSYAFPNDVDRLLLRTYLRMSLAEQTNLRLTHLLENVDFQKRTEFDYDYMKNQIGLLASFDVGITSQLDLEVGFATMSIPDSVEIEYESWTPQIEFRVYPQRHKSFYARAGVENRIYHDGATRSSFWALLAAAGAEWPVGESHSVELSSDLEQYSYDLNTGAYFNYAESRNVLLLNWIHGITMKIGAGPAYAFLLSAGSAEDEYREIGGRIRIDLSGDSSYWLSGWYESGLRRYPAYSSDLSVDGFDAVFSDYTYHRVSLYGTARIRDGFNLNAFADFQPEKHERDIDDATATLLSISLSYTF